MRELNGILAVFVGISSLMTLWRSLRTSPASNKGWIVVSALTLLLTIGIALRAPLIAGFVAGLLWLLFSGLPALGLRWLDQLTAEGRFEEARVVATGLRWLHPADGWTALPRVFDALEMADDRNYEIAETILSEPDVARSPIAQTAAGHVFLMRQDWTGLLSWIQSNRSEAEIGRDPSMIVTYLRTLGEVGELNSLLDAFARLEKQIRQARGKTMGLSYLIVFAFCGQRQLVERLFAGPLSMYPQSIQVLWEATADMAAGHWTEARTHLAQVRDEADKQTKIEIDYRLNADVAQADNVLTPESRQLLNQLLRVVE